MALFAQLTEAAKELFEYNRGNFQYDREMRQKMEYELAEMKIKQTEVWREDIREISELTPEKIEVYLLIIALELGFCVMALAKGRVPPGAPPWLVACHTISVCAALMYFTLAMWFGMHAFVSAQAYKVRILTQLVRAPVPTWRTLEAARTYGSSFERVGRRQMLRIPFLCGTQESVGRRGAARRGAPAGSGSAAALPPVDEDVEEGATADPWNLERPGTEISELAPDVNTATERQRHIWLVREAQKFYQTYDAFCRICMSAGTSSLAIFFCYFCLSRVLTELAAPAAAWGGMIVFISCSLVVMHSDLQLKRHQYVVLSALKFLPPVLSAIVTFHCSKHSGKPGSWEFLMPLALLTHGAGEVYYLFLFNVKEVQTGALLPTAFGGILFLDPFALARHTGTWYKRLRDSAFGGRASASRSRINQSFVAARNPYAASSAFLAQPQGIVPQAEVDGALPATTTFETGAPARPEDIGGSQNCDEAGLGQLSEGPMAPTRGGFARMSTRENISFRPGSFAQPTRAEDEDTRHNIQTGNDIMGEKPGLVPWRVFFLNTSVLTVLWWIAAGVALHNAIAGTANFVPSNYEDLEDGKVAKMAELIQKLPDKFRGHRILTTWGNQSFMPPPTGLACDPQGLSFVTTGASLDAGQSLWHGRMSADTTSITFEPAPRCSAMDTVDSVQDLAMHGCGQGEKEEVAQSCSVLVMPKQATSLVSCPLATGGGAQAAKNLNSATQLLARAWLRDRGGVAQNEEDAENFLIPEDVASLAVAPCGKDDAECAVLGTTGQRVVLMDAVGAAAVGKSPSVVPRRLLHADHGEVPGPGAMSVVNSRYLAVLLRESGNVRMLDLHKGGADSGVWRLPRPTASQAGTPGGKWSAICGVGDSFYALEEGDNPSLWRFPAPDMNAEPHSKGFIPSFTHAKPLPEWTKHLGFVHMVLFVPIAIIAFFRYVDIAWLASLAGCEDVYSFWWAVHASK